MGKAKKRVYPPKSRKSVLKTQNRIMKNDEIIKKIKESYEEK